jgi:hypothetical protein
MRTMVVFWSGDFVKSVRGQILRISALRIQVGASGSCPRFRRNQGLEMYGLRHYGEETHEPVGAWARERHFRSLQAMARHFDRSKNRMDLGFLVSNDGIHFREPIADFPLIKAGPTGAAGSPWPHSRSGYENVGDQAASITAPGIFLIPALDRGDRDRYARDSWVPRRFKKNQNPIHDYGAVPARFGRIGIRERGGPWRGRLPASRSDR